MNSESLLSTFRPKELLTYEESQILQIVNFGIICAGLCVLGISANIINILVFCKQGFAYTMNISLCSLTVSDLCSLVSQLWINICFNPFLTAAQVPFVPEQIQHLTGSGPAACFGHISGWITVFITAERCLGIALPLKVKQIITPTRTAVIIAMIYIINVLDVGVEYYIYHMSWVFYPEKNATLYSLVKSVPDYSVTILSYVLYLFLGYVSFMAVTVLTAILAVKLNQKSAWRQKATKDIEQSTSWNRDRRTVKMVVLIATIMIVCYTPFIVVAVMVVMEPEYSILGQYRNSFYVMLSFGYLFQNINASVNIFLYYNMSTKYRQTFRDFFWRKQYDKNI